MSKVRVKRSEVGGRRTADDLRAKIGRLHALRGAAVLDAKKAREEQGFKSAAFQLDWQHVEDLTRAIVHYEAELERALSARGGAEGAERAPLLRDPKVELPGPVTQMNQVVVRSGRVLSFAVHAVGRTWIEADGQPISNVTGWCPFDEAAEALKAATREVRHG